MTSKQVSGAELVRGLVTLVIVLLLLFVAVDIARDRAEEKRFTEACINSGGIPVSPACLNVDSMHLPYYQDTDS